MSTRPRSLRQRPKIQRGPLLFGLALGAGAWYLARRPGRYSFRHSRVLITGGSRGLGFILAKEFLKEGAQVAIMARAADELIRAQEKLARFGKVHIVPCDITRPEDVERAVGAVTQDWGGIDVLVNNAGIIQVGPVESMTRDDFKQSLNVHFWGSFNMVQAVLPQMKRRRQGRIVNIASIGGKISVPHLLPYNTGKFALVGYSDGLRHELAKDGIRVTTVCPGLMRTGSIGQAQFKGEAGGEHRWFALAASSPLFSVSAERAAREIIEACRRGQGQLTISLPAKVGVFLNTAWPGLISGILGWVNRLLPKADRPSSRVLPGSRVGLDKVTKALTKNSQAAARRYNQVPIGSRVH